jgi:NAD+ diphosphatase
MTVASPRFVPATAPDAPPGDALWFAFRGAELLVVAAPGGAVVAVPTLADLAAVGLAASTVRFLGALGGRACLAADLPRDAPAPAGHRFASVRGLFDRMDRAAFDVAGLAFQLLHFERTHRFCGACGGPLADAPSRRSKRCASCGAERFPPVAPAIIVRVTDGPRVLLTRSAHFPPGMYGLVAGFLEPGESLEACVAREVREETGVEVDEIRYFGSQPWPFPSQVMVGFTARFAGGDVTVDRDELEDARFFERGAMPTLPPKVSIARRLLDDWLDGAPSTR